MNVGQVPKNMHVQLFVGWNQRQSPAGLVSLFTPTKKHPIPKTSKSNSSRVVIFAIDIRHMDMEVVGLVRELRVSNLLPP